MEILESKKSVLIITGMHRSGTSLVASLLQSAGVDIGERLMEPNESNPKGHFEDWDFVEFHQKVLRSQGISTEGWTVQQTIQVQEQYIENAKFLVQKRNLAKEVWGWKDPRTTLFLSFWQTIIPNAIFLFVYRSPWEVVDSLYRRGDEVFKTNPNFAIKIWMSYNQAILDFYENHERCVLLNLDWIIQNPNIVIDALDQKIGMSLDSVGKLYEESLLNRRISNSHRPSLLKTYFPEAVALYQELNTRANLIDEPHKLLFDGTIQFTPYIEWVFQDWLDLRKGEKDLKQLKLQLQQTTVEREQLESQLEETRVALMRSQAQLEQTKIELEQTKIELEQTKIELEQTKIELEQTKIELGQSQLELEQTQAELIQSESQLQLTKEKIMLSQSIISGMESSKFWKIRRIWFKLKGRIGLKAED